MKHLSAICVLLLCTQNVVASDLLTAEFTDDLGEVRVSLCFEGEAPDHLYRNRQAGDWSDGIYFSDERLKLWGRYGDIRLPALPENACINWRSDIGKALEKKNYRLVLKRGTDLIMNADLWFWKGPQSRDLIVNVSVPEGMSFSTPWTMLENTATHTSYRPDKTPAIWESKIAIGRFEMQTIDVPGAQVRLAALGDLTDNQNEKFRLWIKESVLAVASVFGRFPQSQTQVLVIPVGQRRVLPSVPRS